MNERREQDLTLKQAEQISQACINQLLMRIKMLV